MLKRPCGHCECSYQPSTALRLCRATQRYVTCAVQPQIRRSGSPIDCSTVSPQLCDHLVAQLRSTTAATSGGESWPSGSVPAEAAAEDIKQPRQCTGIRTETIVYVVNYWQPRCWQRFGTHVQVGSCHKPHGPAAPYLASWCTTLVSSIIHETLYALCTWLSRTP
jgi:hypothetical protein